MPDEKIKVRVKLGVNEIELEGSTSSLQQAISMIPQILEAIPAGEGPMTKNVPQSQEMTSVPETLTRGPTPGGQLTSALPEIRVEKGDSLTEVITKIFSTSWGRQPRKLSQVREVLESYGLIYPKQSVAVSLLRLAQSSKLRRFKGEDGEFVYVGSALLTGESRSPTAPTTVAPDSTEQVVGRSRLDSFA